MLVICIERILFRALISLNLFYNLFVGLDEAKDVNDSVSGQMSSSKYAGSQWWRELANEHSTLRTLVLTFTFFFNYSLLQFKIYFSCIQFCFILCKFLFFSFNTHTLTLTDLCCYKLTSATEFCLYFCTMSTFFC